MYKHIGGYFIAALVIGLSLALSYYIQIAIASNPVAFAKWLESFGNLIILVYIILQTITIVVAPIGGIFLVVAMIAIFGPAKALILAYLVTTPSYVVNFYIANRQAIWTWNSQEVGW